MQTRPSRKVLCNILTQPSLHIFFIVLIAASMQWYNWGIFGDADAQYHITLAKLTPWWPRHFEFSWLPFTSWATTFADQHYLFHLFLKPFALAGLGQATIIVSFAAQLIAFYWLLKKLVVTYPLPWLWLYAFGSTDLLTRTTLLKAETMGLAFVFICIWLFVADKWKWLIPIATLYTLWYGGSLTTWLLAGTFTVAHLYTTRTLNSKPILYVIIGTGIGLLLSPYRETLPAYLFQQITAAGITRVVPGGNEWNGYPQVFIQDNILIFLPWVSSLLYQIWKKQIPPRTSLFLLVSSLLFGLLTLHTNRFAMYWVATAALYSAITITNKAVEVLQALYADKAQTVRKVLVSILIICAVLLGAKNIYSITTQMHRRIQVDRLKNAAMWLADHTKMGETIINASWEDFPQLWYWNTRNQYLIGLDPAFLWLFDSARYTAWLQLSTNASYLNHYAPIVTAFESTWLILPTTTPLPSFDNRLHLVYEDAAVRILHWE